MLLGVVDPLRRSPGGGRSPSRRARRGASRGRPWRCRWSCCSRGLVPQRCGGESARHRLVELEQKNPGRAARATEVHGSAEWYPRGPCSSKRRTPSRACRSPYNRIRREGVLAVDLAQHVVGQVRGRGSRQRPWVGGSSGRRRTANDSSADSRKRKWTAHQRRVGRRCRSRTGRGPASARRTRRGRVRLAARAPRSAPRCRRGSSGSARGSSTTRARSSAAQPTWAPMNVVAGWRATTASSPSISSSNGGKPSSSGPPGGPRRPEVPVGVVAAAPPSARCVVVERVEERDRVGDVDRDRDAQLAGRRPQRVEARVVDRDEPRRAGRAPAGRAVFQTLRPAGAGRHAVAQPRRLGLAERRVVGPARVVEARRTPRRARAAAACQRSISRRSPSPQPPSRSTIASTPAASITAAELGGRARRPVAAERAARGGCARRSPGNRGRGTWRRRHAEPLPRPVVRERERHRRRRPAQPLSPLSAIPRTKYCCASDEQHDHRREADQRPGHHLRPLAHELALEERQPDGRRVLVEVPEVDERVEQVVPGPHEREDRQRRERRLGERQVDPAEDLPRVGAVDPGGVGELARDGQEELAQQERPERAAQQGADPQRLLGAV